MFNFDLSLRRNSLKTILLVIPLFSENLTSLLSPTLGQYGLDISTFIESFLLQTRFFRDELTVRVFLTLFSDNTFSFFIIPISYHFLLRSVCEKIDSNQLSVFETYKILRLYSIVSKNLNPLFLKNSYLNLRGYISSYNVVSD
jgi:hypothetical protein